MCRPCSYQPGSALGRYGAEVLFSVQRGSMMPSRLIAIAAGVCGTVFPLGAAAYSETVLYNFRYDAEPRGQLLPVNPGTFYGTMEVGKKGFGSVYQLTQTDGQWTANTERKLRNIAKALERDGDYEPKIRRDVSPGVVLTREWKSVIHKITVTTDGFQHLGKRYGSLSDIARTMTDTRRSGPRFFGLEQKQHSKPKTRRAPTTMVAGEVS